MRKKFYFLVGFVLPFLIYYSCTDDEIYVRDDRFSIRFSIDDARAFFETNATDLSPLRTFSGEVPLSRGASPPVTEMIPEWDNALVSGHEGVTLIEIPLRTFSTAMVREQIHVEGKAAVFKNTRVIRRLVIAKQAAGTVDMFVATIVPDVFSDCEASDFRYLGGGNFTGKVFCSTLEGQFVKAFGYRDGKLSGRVAVIPTGELTEEERAGLSDFSSLSFGELEGPQARSYSFGEGIGGGGGTNPGGGGSTNPGGGGGTTPGGGGSIWIPEVTVTVCPYCHTRDGCWCPRCFYCGKIEPKCSCRRCLRCQKKTRECTCYQYPPPGGGGGGSVGGGDSTPPEENTPSASKIARVELEKSVKIAVDSMLKKFGKATAACNYGVQVVFNRHFNTRELNNKRANDMVDHWEAHPEKWESIEMSQAQQLANDGYFVVAGWKAAPGKSGHVVVIVPGQMKYSGKWECNVPMSMDTGAKMKVVSQPLSHSFGHKIKIVLNILDIV